MIILGVYFFFDMYLETLYWKKEYKYELLSQSSWSKKWSSLPSFPYSVKRKSWAEKIGEKHTLVKLESACATRRMFFCGKFLTIVATRAQPSSSSCCKAYAKDWLITAGALIAEAKS